MSQKTRLYDAFGEMMYVLAMADGVIQPEEKEALTRILENHPYGKDVVWSFNYEVGKNPNLEEVYQRVLNICHENGPDPEYQFLLELMGEVAKASEGIDPAEQKVINRFTQELTQRFKEDIARINQN